MVGRSGVQSVGMWGNRTTGSGVLAVPETLDALVTVLEALGRESVGFKKLGRVLATDVAETLTKSEASNGVPGIPLAGVKGTPDEERSFLPAFRVAAIFLCLSAMMNCSQVT